MFSSRKQPRISLIAEGTRIEGDVRFADKMRIDGDVVGNVSAHDAASQLVVSEIARVEGTLRADHVVVNGTVVGAVHAAEMLELHAKARIDGDVHYKSLEMHKGAVISGQLCPIDGHAVADKTLLKLAANNP
jgi:cytoskeletal protein CcmA (bactofilin family)